MADKQKFPIKRNDLLPDLVVTLLDGTTPVNLTAAVSVRFVMSNRTGVKVDEPMAVTDATAGEVTYSWQPGDTDTKGLFNAEIEVMWPGDKPQTFPAEGYFQVAVGEDLDLEVGP